MEADSQTVQAIILSAVWQGVLFVTLIVIATLSRIMGAAMKKKPLYKWIYVSAGLILFTQTFNLLVSNTEFKLISQAVFVLSLLVGVGITGYYWGWLLKEVLGSIEKA